jgi:uncharacterized protein DUF998
MTLSIMKTKTLLSAGVIAGPLYVGLAVLQMVIRPGFDPTRHDWSLLSNGDLGWIQITNFLLTGALVICAAIGIRQVLRGKNGGTWGPLLLALYGLGLIGAGLCVADPMNGFPLSTPDGPPVHPTMSGVLHIVTGAFGFIGLIAACFVIARYFRSINRPLWARYSIITGIVFLLSFIGIASGSQQKGAALQAITLGFTFGVLLAWSWLSSVSFQLTKLIR